MDSSPAATTITVTNPFKACASTPTFPSMGVRLFVGGLPLTDDLRTLLHRRLLFAVTVVAVMYGYFAAVWMAGNPGYEFEWFSARDWLYFGCVHAVFLFGVTSSLVLRTRRDVSLHALRVVEFFGVGGILLHQLAYEYVSLFLMPSERVWSTSMVGAALSARAQTLSWFALIIGYGVFVPNTWRRCLWVLGAFAAAALGLNIAAAVARGTINSPPVVRYLAETAAWLVFAVVFAVYNAYRIDLLRAATEASRQLGQYRLTLRIGAGGMGEVYLAEHLLLCRPCAVKLIRRESAGDPAALVRFEREAQAAAALSHPHIVRVHDYGQADGTFYCVMDYLSGVTLDHLVEQHGPLPAARVVFLLRQICSALAAAHDAGFTHRDMKPGNVIVRNHGRLADFATLLDFGLVLDASDRGLTGELAGTPAFMAPEQSGTGQQVGPLADVYGVGAIGYFLLAGHPPFAGRSVWSMVAAVRGVAPAPLRPMRSNVPAALESVILRCLEKDPGRRFASMDQLDAALAACVVEPWSYATAATWWANHHASEPASGQQVVPSDAESPTDGRPVVALWNRDVTEVGAPSSAQREKPASSGSPLETG